APADRRRRRTAAAPVHAPRDSAGAPLLGRRPAAHQHGRASRDARRVRGRSAPRERAVRSPGVSRDRRRAAPGLDAATPRPADGMERGRGRRGGSRRRGRDRRAGLAATGMARERRGELGADGCSCRAGGTAGDDRGHGAGPRYVAVVGMRKGRTTLVVDGEPTPVDSGFLERHWFGTAHIFWRDFETLGPAFGREGRGTAVARLQALLRGVGTYHGAVNGLFDGATES